MASPCPDLGTRFQRSDISILWPVAELLFEPVGRRFDFVAALLRDMDEHPMPLALLLAGVWVRANDPVAVEMRQIAVND